jgi:hypothetical protein
MTCWTTDATGQVVSADTFGFVKRSVVDQEFGQAQPWLELSHRGLVISTTGQFARCGNDWKVTGYDPESDSSFAFRLKSRPLFLKAPSDGQLCRSGRKWDNAFAESGHDAANHRPECRSGVQD